MKVTFFFRPKLPFVFSVETIFDLIKPEFEGKFEIAEYYCTTKWKRLYSLLEAPKYQGDVNHILGDVYFLTLSLKKKNTIVTVLDMGHYERTLKGIKKFFFKIFWFDIPLKRAAVITTISEFTKSKLLQYTNVPASKIHVVHVSAPTDFTFSPKTFNAKKPCILQIGSSSPNKNLHRLIEALEGINCSLILVRKRDSKFEKLLVEKNIEAEWFENIDRKELFECYKKCDIVFFASEHEGFGVPILEGNTIGRAVITGNTTAMPEVAGDGALLVNPYDVEEIRAGIIKLIADEAFREELIKKGTDNVKRFSSEKIAQQYIDLYEMVYNK